MVYFRVWDELLRAEWKSWRRDVDIVSFTNITTTGTVDGSEIPKNHLRV